MGTIIAIFLAFATSNAAVDFFASTKVTDNQIQTTTTTKITSENVVVEDTGGI